MPKIYFIHKRCGNKLPSLSLDYLINEGEVLKETAKGFRIKRGRYEGQHSHNHYFFFNSLIEALKFVADEANKSVGYYEEKKLSAIRLMCEANDKIKNEVGHA